MSSDSYTPSYRDEHAIAHHFVNVLEQRLAGRYATRQVNTHPHDWVHLGVLGPMKGDPAPVEVEAAGLDAEQADTASAPEVSKDANAQKRATAAPADQQAGETEAALAPADKREEFDTSRRPPSALGFEVLIAPDDRGDIEFTVESQACFFSKHLPTYVEQQTVAAGSPLVEVAQRWPVEFPPVRFRLPAGTRGAYDDGGVLQAVLDTATSTASASSDIERLWPKGARVKVDEVKQGIRDQATFQAFLDAQIQGLPAEQVSLQASIEVRVTPRPDGMARVGVYICNRTPETPRDQGGRALKDAFKTLADASLAVAFQAGTLAPIEILPVPHDYQYDRRVWAVGHNTSVVCDLGAASVRTKALAVYEQTRIATSERVKARFSELATDPFEVLTAVHAAMLDYERHWREDVVAANSLSLPADALAECAKDLAAFQSEIARFCCGVAALRSDDRLFQAFKATNRIFGRLARGYDAWRLFQLVFLVTQLPSLALREGRVSGEYPPGVAHDWTDALDWGDVLWFRTGGGKTEAYLGLCACAMLYDRLRGKSFGLTAWLRFPLRMLSIQQLQRAMRVVWEAEVERKVLLGDAARDSDPIRLGYFVGSTTTPNSLSEEELQKRSSPEALEKLRVIADCPNCGAPGSIRVTADTKAVRFRHVCDRCHAELPLDISDDEVYRHLPALLIGTVDKMASVGQQPKFGMLWGGARRRCPIHGYGLDDYCTVFGCKHKPRPKVKPYDPAPALHIQDELHLLQEELGAFAGHYETLIRYCEKSLSGRPSKVVAATATIEGFERQVQHLYGVRHARRFPGRGFDKLKSFYAEPDTEEGGGDKTARIFIAFRSPSMQAADASAYCAQILHEEISRLIDAPASALPLLTDAQSDQDVLRLLHYYSTTLSYVGSLARGSRVKESLQQASGKVRPNATPRELTIDYLNSRSTSAEVAEAVHKVESPPAWADGEFIDAVVATNMISHGVDLERVNLMTMDGVPEETAEYIQASSRSGRKHVGIVVVVLSSYSLRASSIYHRFIEYHEHLDRMVSPVPVNRFAKYAAQRTAPGVALGLIYGKHIAETGSNKLTSTSEARTLLNRMDGAFLDEAKEAYSLGQSIYDERLERALGATIEERFDIFRLGVNNSHEDKVRNAVKPAPMTSLRDVEAGVPFWPDANADLLNFVRRTRE